MSWVEPEVFESDGLLCRRVSLSAKPRVFVLLCHGYGAPGTDLVPLATELIRSSEEIAESVSFVFPQAPLSLGGFPGFEQRAWWPIDVGEIEAAHLRGDFVERRTHCPGELPRLRQQLGAVLSAEQERSGLGIDRAVLGGFSQGSMVTTDLALHLEENPAALVVFSGTLLCETEWRAALAARTGAGPLKVLQSHGRSDPLLPFAAAEALGELLRSSGAELDFVPFEGQHEIPMPALSAFRELLLGTIQVDGDSR